jgi:hypothetical protein
MRKAANEGFNKGSVKRFHEKQTMEAILITSDFFAKPVQWDRHFRRAAASMIMSVVYGHPAITSEHDHSAEAINDFAARLTIAAYPGAYLVEFFTWMRHIPSR